jgi:hypothetical protein
MGNVTVAKQVQTLFVTIRRDELHDLKAERDQLQRKVAQLTAMISPAANGIMGSPAVARLG